MATAVDENRAAPPRARRSAKPPGALPRARWLRIVRLALAVIGVMALIMIPWWGPPALSQLDYFHVRRIAFEGVRHARATELVALLRVDTTQSVWQAMAPLARRVATHVLVASAAVERRLPGTLVVHVVEREPVALVQTSGRLQPTDARGRVLPIDPSRLDLPLVSVADSTLLSFLEALRVDAPRLFARISAAERANDDELQFHLGSVLVRANSDVTVARFKDILPVEADFAQNRLRAVEFDLRFRDQVIARQP